MTDEPRPRGGHRRLTADERALWDAATRAVRPSRRARPKIAKADASATAPAAPATPAVAMPVTWPSATPIRPLRPAPPPLAPIARRMTQRVARGRVEIDARIDLHGMTQERAHGALLHFLRRAQMDAAKVVLVITGKGGRGSPAGGSGRGVLRGVVPQWLALPDFRTCVVGFEPAHITHGGDGALYVQIRRRRG
jgi:DNA-nicking Smr family endonuclease